MEAMMATAMDQGQTGLTANPAVMRAVTAPAEVCGDCRYHMPQATQPERWCALPTAMLHDQQVDPGRQACQDFTTWPEGSPVPAFLAAMGF